MSITSQRGRGRPDLRCVPTLSQYVSLGRETTTPEDHEQATMTDVRPDDLGRPSFTRLTPEDPRALRPARDTDIM
jgi:hypothetical protein